MKQKIRIDMMKLSAEKCAEYLLESERDDFIENPSTDHIYFYAYTLANGPREAIEVLNQALKGELK